MTYSVEYTKSAIKELRKLDSNTRKLLLSWIEKNLVNCSNPRAHGKALRGDKSDQWRYRVGDYRILANIQDDKVVILVLKVGHRREIYE